MCTKLSVNPTHRLGKIDLVPIAPRDMKSSWWKLHRLTLCRFRSHTLDCDAWRKSTCLYPLLQLVSKLWPLKLVEMLHMAPLHPVEKLTLVPSTRLLQRFRSKRTPITSPTLPPVTGSMHGTSLRLQFVCLSCCWCCLGGCHCRCYRLLLFHRVPIMSHSTPSKLAPDTRVVFSCLTSVLVFSVSSLSESTRLKPSSAALTANCDLPFVWW